jgi:methyl-accepting chemotaxis protein
MSRTAAQVTQLQGLLGQIASAAEQEATALGEVNAAMSELDNVTQQNATMVQQTTATVRSLGEKVDQLVSHVSRFRIDPAMTGQLRPARGETRAALALARD